MRRRCTLTKRVRRNTMEQSKIDRINELARKNRAGGLTEDELKEREADRKSVV